MSQELLPGPAVPQWEYHIESYGSTDEYGPNIMAATLERLGIDGWELVAIHGTYMAFGVFKRRRIGMIAFDEETGMYRSVKPDG